MKPRTLCLVLALCIATTTAACSSDSDISSSPGDAGVESGSGSNVPPDAGPAAITCSHTRVLPAYPWGVTAGAYFADRRLTFGILADSTSSAYSRLWLELWPAAGGSEPSVPMQRTFTTLDRYATCETCLLIGEGCTTSPNTCRTYYFAQAGQLHVNEAGRSEADGNLRATGSALTFVEWSMQADAPVANSRCIKLTSLALDAEWGSGGTCSGDACGAGCCADSPYCSLGDNNIGRYCSDFCGESGDGCTGPNDCCDGFRCFFGTCMVDSCGADSCTTGLDEGGGCCDQAPYCVEGGCSAACGLSGSGCGGDLDCCSGLSCNAGTCS